MAAPAASASFSTSLAYDALNRPMAVNWSPAPSQTTPAPATATFTFAYDATNRRVGQTATDNSWWSYPAATNVSYTANTFREMIEEAGFSIVLAHNCELRTTLYARYYYLGVMRLNETPPGWLRA